MKLHCSAFDFFDEFAGFCSEGQVRYYYRKNFLGHAPYDRRGRGSGETVVNAGGKLQSEAESVHPHVVTEQGFLQRRHARHLNSGRPQGTTCTTVELHARP